MHQNDIQLCTLNCCFRNNTDESIVYTLNCIFFFFFFFFGIINNTEAGNQFGLSLSLSVACWIKFIQGQTTNQQYSKFANRLANRLLCCVFPAATHSLLLSTFRPRHDIIKTNTFYLWALWNIWITHIILTWTSKMARVLYGLTEMSMSPHRVCPRKVQICTYMY